MRNRDNDYFELVDYVNEVVAECSKSEFANALVQWLS